MLRELANLFCGALLGQGQDRDTYAHALDPKLVIKVERSAGSFQNVIEWETWKQIDGTPYARWFAPCHAISSCGVALVMTRVAELPPKGDPLLRGLMMPSFFTDFKRSNYGVLKGRVVACDYGITLAMNNVAYTSKLERVRWRTDAP